MWNTLRLVQEQLEQQLSHCRLFHCPDLPPCTHCAAAVLHSAVKRLDKFQLILDTGETEDRKAAVRAGVVRLISEHSDKSRIIRQREAALAAGASLLSCEAQQQEVYARLQ